MQPRYSDDKYRTLQEVASDVGVSRERVRQVVNDYGLTLAQAAEYLRENAKLRENGTKRPQKCALCDKKGHNRKSCETGNLSAGVA